MATRNGKIANLPNDIREQLNLRLLEGETGRELAAWLNALPLVQSILAGQFNASPISEVNLTHWRQGGYLQWLTERECFEAARALADGDGDLAKTGLSAERLLNILTLRYGQLLTRWDFSPDESVSETAAFSEIARKARILQGISRSLLTIHRIQSQSASKKPDLSTSSANPHGRPEQGVQPSFSEEALTEGRKESLSAARDRGECRDSERETQGTRLLNKKAGRLAAPPGKWVRGAGEGGDLIREPHQATPKILSGSITPSTLASKLSQTPFNANADLIEALQAV